MYMIAGLCMLKLYQKRHPDINASAYTAYACLAAVIFFSVLGVVRTHTHTYRPHHSEALGEVYTRAETHMDIFWSLWWSVCRYLGKETWSSGSFSQWSTSWPLSSSAHSSTTWAGGGSVRSRQETWKTPVFRSLAHELRNAVLQSFFFYYSVIKRSKIYFFMRLMM